MRIPTDICQIDLNGAQKGAESWGADHLTENSGWGVESIMVSHLLVYRRSTTFVTV